jgi:hypothetical protein
VKQQLNVVVPAKALVDAHIFGALAASGVSDEKHESFQCSLRADGSFAYEIDRQLSACF